MAKKKYTSLVNAIKKGTTVMPKVGSKTSVINKWNSRGKKLI